MFSRTAPRFLKLAVAAALVPACGGGGGGGGGGGVAFVVERVSVAGDGSQGTGVGLNPWWPQVSSDGRIVAFVSTASDLVPGDTNGMWDIFVRDFATGLTERASVSGGGAEANGSSNVPSLSEDGRYLAFQCEASNLVAGDTNDVQDIFVRDRQTGQTSRVNVATGGAQAQRGGFGPSISADGRWVAFGSFSSDLVAGDTNGMIDIFVHDRQTAATVRVSLSSAGAETNSWSEKASISADGRFVAFESSATNLAAGDTNGMADLFVHDRDSDADEIYDEPGAVSTVRANVSTAGAQANGPSTWARISAGGRYVAFESNASNLVAGDTNNRTDVFVRDLQAGTTVRVSISTAGIQGDGSSFAPVISQDGRFVAFGSAATVFAPPGPAYQQLYVHDRDTNLDGVFDEPGAISTTAASVGSGGAFGAGQSYDAAISADGRYVAFASFAQDLVPGDTNLAADVFRRDRQAGQTALASLRSDGSQPLAGSQASSLRSFASSDGRYVAFTSESPNLVAGDTNGVADVFVRDRVAGTTTRVSVSTAGAEATWHCYAGGITPDGRYVVFQSTSSALSAGESGTDNDVFVHDRQTGETTRASVPTGGGEGNGNSLLPSISADGVWVAFQSSAINLVAGDTNGMDDIFLHNRTTGITSRVSVSTAGAQANGSCWQPSISADGRYVAFDSLSSTLVSGDTNNANDVFVHDRTTGTTVRVSVAGDGSQGTFNTGWGRLSGDGRYVVFGTASVLTAGDANGLPDTFLHDRDADGDGVFDELGQIATTRISSAGGEADQPSYYPVISADGRYVAFESKATTLVSGDANGLSDVFVHDRQIGQTVRASMASTGAEASGGALGSGFPEFSADGRWVSFWSWATNLVPGDTNGVSDIFLARNPLAP